MSHSNEKEDKSEVSKEEAEDKIPSEESEIEEAMKMCRTLMQDWRQLQNQVMRMILMGRYRSKEHQFKRHTCKQQQFHISQIINDQLNERDWCHLYLNDHEFQFYELILLIVDHFEHNRD